MVSTHVTKFIRRLDQTNTCNVGLMFGLLSCVFGQPVQNGERCPDIWQIDRYLPTLNHYYSGNKILVFYFLLSTYERKLSPIVIWIWGWHPRLLARVWYLVSGVHVRGSVYIQPCHRDDLCTTVIPRTKWKYHMVTIRSITSAQIYTIPVYASQSLRYSE